MEGRRLGAARLAENEHRKGGRRGERKTFILDFLEWASASASASLALPGCPPFLPLGPVREEGLVCACERGRVFLGFCPIPYCHSGEQPTKRGWGRRKRRGRKTGGESIDQEGQARPAIGGGGGREI